MKFYIYHLKIHLKIKWLSKIDCLKTNSEFSRWNISSKFITELIRRFNEIKHMLCETCLHDLREIYAAYAIYCRRCLYELRWHLREFRILTTPISIGVTRARLSCFCDSRSCCVTVVSWRLRSHTLSLGHLEVIEDIVATRVVVMIVQLHSYSNVLISFVH